MDVLKLRKNLRFRKIACSHTTQKPIGCTFTCWTIHCKISIYLDMQAKLNTLNFCTMLPRLKSPKRSGYGMKEGENAEDLNLSLPVTKPNIEIPVIELILK